MQDLVVSYRILQSIYQKGAFASLELSNALDKANNKDIVTKIVYGVLERNIELDYFIDQLTSKKPKLAIAIILKMGMYHVKYLDSIPNYAVVSKMVDLTEKIGKKELKGFVNATLKKFITWGGVYPEELNQKLSIKYSTPLWLVDEYIKEYGVELTEKIIAKDEYVYEHIRVNKNTYSMQELLDVMEEFRLKFDPSQENAIYTKYKKILKQLYISGKITLQSKTSMICCEKLEVKDNDKVLDLCAAPGGKSVYLSEMANCSITSCDIYDHRLDLIKSYINRMHAKNITVVKNDATVYNEEFLNVFDKVLCDVPCSGLGVVKKKPDIFLNLNLKDVESLATMQYQILVNARNYVKVGGTLIYSTCTTLSKENKEIIRKFLSKYKNEFELVEDTQYLPIEKGIDGFYIAKLRRIK